MPETEPFVRFEGVLERDTDTPGIYIRIPFDIAALFGARGRIPVRVTINGYVFRTTLALYGGTHYLGVNQAVRAAAGVQVGERVDVRIELDREPRTVTPPDDLAAALETNPAALERWQRLSYSHQKEYVDAINEAKKPETRTRRIQNTIEALGGSK